MANEPTNIIGTTPVINPIDNSVGEVSNDKLIKAITHFGYKLAPVQPGSKDIDPQNSENILVRNPLDNSIGSVAKDNWNQVRDLGYSLASTTVRPTAQEYQGLVQDQLQKLSSIKDPNHPFQGVSKSIELSKEHASDDIQDEFGNYKMLGPHGQEITIPASDMLKAIDLPGFKFRDPKFQAAIEARLLHQKTSTDADKAGYSLTHTIGSAVNSYIFGIKNAIDEENLSRPEWGAAQKIQTIADKIAAQDQFKTENVVGSVLGLAAGFKGGGALGELNIAKGTGQAILGAKALESSPILARTLATAAEGAIISAPHALAQGVIQKDPKIAAESLLLGIGLGGALGFGSGLISKGVEGLGVLKTLQAEKTLQTLGAGEEVLPQISKPEQFLKSLTKEGLSAKSKPEEIQNVLTKVAKLQGQEASNILGKLDDISAPISNSGLLGNLERAASDSFLYKNEKLVALTSALSNDITRLSNKAGEISLNDIQRVSKQLAEMPAKDEILAAAKKQLTKDFSIQLSEAADMAAQKADAKLASAWSETKALSQIAEAMQSKFGEAIEKGELKVKDSPIVKFISNGLAGAIGGPIGHAIGGPVGGFIGYNVVKPTISKAVENYLTNPSNDSKLLSWIGQNKASQAIGSYMVLDAVHNTAQKLQDINPFIKNLAIKTPVAFLASENPIKTILGGQANGLSKQQQFERLSQHTANVVTNPQMRDLHTNDLLNTISAHPELSLQIREELNNRAQFISNLLHANNQSTPMPFKAPQKYQATPAQMQDIEDQLKIVINPYALLDGLKNGKVTAKQVNVAAQLNPAILQAIRSEIIKEAYSGKSALNYQQTLAASTIMGQAMDPSLRQLPQIQAQFAQSGPPPGAQQKEKKSSGHKGSSTKNVDNHLTMAQRISH